METGKITVVLAGDNKYALPLTVAARSVAATLEPCQHLDLCVLDMGIDAENRAKMEASFKLPGVDVIWVDSLVDRVANFPNTWPIITRATYARIYIPEVLPDVERALYIDCDVLARRNVGELFHAEMNGYWALASPDVQAPFVPFGVPNWYAVGRSAGDLNFNAGVLLMDLDAWRREGLTESLLRYLTDGRHLRAQDQEAINCGARVPHRRDGPPLEPAGGDLLGRDPVPLRGVPAVLVRVSGRDPSRSLDGPLLEPPEALALRLPTSLPRRVVRDARPDRVRRLATDGPSRTQVVVRGVGRRAQTRARRVVAHL